MCLCPPFSCPRVVKQTPNLTQHARQHAVLCLVLVGSLGRAFTPDFDWSKLGKLEENVYHFRP